MLVTNFIPIFKSWQFTEKSACLDKTNSLFHKCKPIKILITSYLFIGNSLTFTHF